MKEREVIAEEQEFLIWLENGVERGWISWPYCNTHDGGYQFMSEEELEYLDAGGDPCETVIRLFQ